MRERDRKPRKRTDERADEGGADGWEGRGRKQSGVQKGEWINKKLRRFLSLNWKFKKIIDFSLLVALPAPGSGSIAPFTHSYSIK